MANHIQLSSLPELLFTLYLLVVFPLQQIWKSRHPSPRKQRPPLQSYWRQARFALVLLAVLLLVMWSSGHTASSLGLAFPTSRPALYGLGAACALLLALHLVNKRMELKMTPAQRAKQKEEVRDLPFAMPRTSLETSAYLFTTILMTAAWEILFRGYLLLVLPPLAGLPAAVALAAIAYGAAHGYKSPQQFAGSIAASFGFAIGYALTGNLWWLIVLHAAAPVSILFAVRKLQGSAAETKAAA
jgi:membrane protease YdiL (CAAX protease family)